MVMRVYTVARSAHLERLRDFSPSHLYYFKKSYDFHAPTNGASWTKCSSLFSLLKVMWLSRDEVIEINEPLSLGSWPITISVVTFNHLQKLLCRSSSRLVSYAIENMDVSQALSSKFRVPHWFARFVVRLCAGYIASSMDKIAFGTLGAQENYASIISPKISRRLQHRLFVALPEACECASPIRTHRGPRFVFLGSLEERKGFGLLSEAWTKTASAEPDFGNLTVLGKGPMEPTAHEMEARWPARVEVKIDPTRAIIHEVLRDSDFLVLMSQPEDKWREQIGLPILEALSHGVHVVTTEETGVAPWLRANGHTVLASYCDADALAKTLLDVSNSVTSPEEILETLPERDQRVAADEWLCGGHP